MKREMFITLFCLLAVVGTAAYGEDATTSTTMLSLEGNHWLVAADQDNAGREQAWWTAPRPEAKAVRVPGILQEALPGYHGVAWYWHEFTPPRNPYANGRCMIRFHAVDYRADVWLNDVHVGMHEGGETPFTFDVTGTIMEEQVNRIAVRVLNPRNEPIDGIVLAETPHRNKAAAGITVGGSYNSGGITEPVEVFFVPELHITDVYVRADWKTGLVRIQTTTVNGGAVPVDGQFQFIITPALANQRVAAYTTGKSLQPGSNQFDVELPVENHRLWQLEEPFLYRLSVRVVPLQDSNADMQAHDYFVRFGFRDFRVVNGFFHLNGKRIFLKSSHTGNHCPVGAILPPPAAPDLLRKDLLYAKSCGFNTVRFIAGIAHPYQLDVCDEIGLMVYEENLASWCLADSPQMKDRFDANLREMVLRDRNHPCLTIFGLMNEVGNGPVVQHAATTLNLLRSLDDTRLVLFQSGRWDGLYNIGSIANPGSLQWEYAWGVESAEYEGIAKNGPWGGYFEGAGDAHVYPATPHTPAIEAGIRNLGVISKPVFLSEYGIGSLMNAVRELRYYEQSGANPEWDDFKFFKQTEEKLAAAWEQYGMEDVYAFPEEMLRDSQRLHGRQRLLGFNLIRSNPNICGYNLTGLLDHGYTGEGLWTFWREFKPGIMDVLQDGWAPLRWCLFVAPMHGYLGRPITLEVVLANENALVPGSYPALLRVLGPDGAVWEKRQEVIVPEVPAGENGPLAIPVFKKEVVLDGPEGKYTLYVTLEHGGAPAGGRLDFYLTKMPRLERQVPVAVIGVESGIVDWLKNSGVDIVPFDAGKEDKRQVVLVGDWPEPDTDGTSHVDLLRSVASGAVAVFLKPGVFKKGDDATGWLPLKNKGGITYFPDWLYHKECVAKKHVLFDGLQPRGVMDWDYYGPLITNVFYEGQDTPDDVAAVALAVCHSSRPDGFAAGVMLGAYNFGAGKIVLNTFNILDNVNKHPAADKLLLNLIGYAAETTEPPIAPLPPDFDTTLKEIGY